jgi:hypothetical protein
MPEVLGSAVLSLESYAVEQGGGRWPRPCAGGGIGAAIALGGGHLIASFGYVELFLVSVGAARASSAFLWSYDRRRTPLRAATQSPV